jgi:myosin heavy subunit
MAFENFPTASGTTPEPPQPPKTDWRFFTTIGLVILLLGTWGYIIWDKSKVKETIQQKDMQYAGVVAEKDTLNSMLEEASIRYDLLKTSSAKKDSVITAKDRIIAEKQSKIKSILSKANATKEELAEAKTLIASLNTDIETYKQQIEVLKGENAQLTQEKQAVTEERNAYQRNADSARGIISDKNKLLDVGATLHASNFNIIGINLKGNGRESETSKAKRVDKLRISFSLDENRITASGTKDLYICITDPEAKPISDNSIGSGTMDTREDGSRNYTQKVAVNYVQGQKQVVSFDWKQGGDYKVGTYKIEVYQNGFKIGEGLTAFRKSGLF